MTEYRIIQNPDHLHDIYLQFKDKKRVGFFSKKEVVCWRYVPDFIKSQVSGSYLQRGKCIEDGKFTSYDSFEHLGNYFGGESLFNGFITKWKNIDDFFVFANKIREEYLRTYDPSWYNNYCKRQKEIKDKNISEFKTIYCQ